MDEIRPWLYIGNFRDALDKTYLDFMSIQAMLLFANPVDMEGITVLYLSIEDISPTPPKLIRQGVDFILEEKQKGHKILVSCGAGISRSTAYCVAALREVEGLSLLDAYKEVRLRHPEGLPNKIVWEAFCKYYKDPTPYLDVMRASVKNY
jgi:predicted protein tyrosine phosphatase